MSDPNPEFGVRRLAFVSGQGGRLFLPGGGMQPGEPPKDALLREIIEEIGWRAHIRNSGQLTQEPRA